MDVKQLEQSLKEELKVIPDNDEGASGKDTGSSSADQDQNKGGASEHEAENKGGESSPAVKKYKDSLGRELSADEIFEEHQKQLSYVTKLETERKQLAQEKADLEKKMQEQSKGNGEPKNDTNNSDHNGLSAQDRAVLEELKRLGFVRKEDVVTKGELDEVKSKWEREIVDKSVKTTAARNQLVQALDELEEDFDGSEDQETHAVKPKVTRQEILTYINENPGVNMSPLQIAQVLHHEDFVKYEAARMVKNPNPLPRTESAGIGEHNPPPPPRYSFNNDSVEKGLGEILKTA